MRRLPLLLALMLLAPPPLPGLLLLASAASGPLLEEEGGEGEPGGRGFPPRGLLQMAQEDAKEAEEMVPGRVEPQGLLLLLPREGRSPVPPPPPPRRCVRLQESCLGQRLPCCDPCAACYCRFFNANCFCKRFGPPASASFPCGRN